MLRSKFLAGTCRKVCTFASDKARVNIRCGKLPAPNAFWPPALLSFCQPAPVPFSVSVVPAMPCVSTCKLGTFDDAEDWDPFQIEDSSEIDLYDGPF